MQVLDAVDRVTNREIKRVIGPRRLGDSAELISDNRKILSTLPWRPQHDDLDKIVRDALAWERKLAERG
jgi:UDP-glucose 4-epimerase